jgi:hypothetical protein
MANAQKEGTMHPLAPTNKYMGLMFMKINKEFFALGRDEMRKISLAHAKDLTKYKSNLTHVVCSGLDPRYDQITIVEADRLEEIHNATVDFKVGAKSRYIDVIDSVIGIKGLAGGKD